MRKQLELDAEARRVVLEAWGEGAVEGRLVAVARPPPSIVHGWVVKDEALWEVLVMLEQAGLLEGAQVIGGLVEVEPVTHTIEIGLDLVLVASDIRQEDEAAA